MRLKNFIVKNKENLPGFNDLLILSGSIMAGKGLYMIYKPAMWVVCGIFLVYLGWPKAVK